MTKEEKELIHQIIQDHGSRNYFDGKRKSYTPSARDALILLGKEIKEDGSFENRSNY